MKGGVLMSVRPDCFFLSLQSMFVPLLPARLCDLETWIWFIAKTLEEVSSVCKILEYEQSMKDALFKI